MDAKENWNRTKEVLGAAWRQGLNELASVTYGPGTAAQPAQYGMPGTKRPSEISASIHGKGGKEDAEVAPPSGLQAHLDAAKAESGRDVSAERDIGEPERE